VRGTSAGESMFRKFRNLCRCFDDASLCLHRELWSSCCYMAC